MPFRFNMLLRDVGIEPDQVRLLRHTPKVGKRSLIDIWRADRALFESYQSVQDTVKRSTLERPWWAAFIGTSDGRTMFAGLYEIGTPVPIEHEHVDAISGEVAAAGTVDRFPAARSSLLEPYEGRLFIEWGGGSSGKLAWVQKAEGQDKIISELHLDAVAEPFPGLMRLSAPLSSFDAAPPSWIEQLRRAKGVYLLSCPRDGSLYVGSATGEDGFWGRWEAYRANGHGGNVAMRGREASDYLVSVLEVAGSTATSDDILAAEAGWKRKLQTREHGLTRN